MKQKDRVLTLLKKISSSLSNDGTPLEGKTLERIETELTNIQVILARKSDENAPQDTVYIWSDGACKGNPGPGGWASVIQIDGEQQEIFGALDHTTNNIMELTAALEGIRMTPTGSRIILTTDSQYLIKGISEWIVNWKKNSWKKKDGSSVLNRDLWQALDIEVQSRKIEWQWIKGHSGHPENERCDQLAKSAITNLLG